MEERIRMLIADDHPLFRKGLHGLLDSVNGIEVVGEVTEREEAIALAERLQPDVILMDINMPGVNGIDATRRILHLSPSVGVLVLTMYEDGIPGLSRTDGS
jgi:DNA-binding NarL/FixJ family response regulator